jgi:sulfofructose kinase
LLILGHAAHDLVYRLPAIPARPVKVLATSFYECGGGMAGNACVAVARLGGRASYWGRVADDALGERILSDLAAEGVDVSTVRRVAGCRSPVTSILVSDAGERLICSFTDPELDPDPGWLPLDRVATFAAVMVDVRWHRGAARLLDAARAAGVPALIDADVAGGAVLGDLIPRASHVLFSEAGLAAWADGANAGEALRRAQRSSHSIVGATLGSEGFLWLENGQEKRLVAPRVSVVDTLAAGDVWHGAFALAIAEGRPIAAAAAFANTAAALKCQRRGGRLGAPTRAEVDAALQLEHFQRPE